MGSVRLEIDDKELTAKEGMTILEGARSAGIDIPSLCYHEKLAPYGACRLCTVEIIGDGTTRLVTACNYPVEEGLVVRTDTERVRRLRRAIVELLLPLAPHKALQDLAREYDLEKSRFEADQATFCILCGLCVRYCSEIKKERAIGFVGRGTKRRVVFFPKIASTVCMSCRECFGLCPTGKISSETDGVCFDDNTIEDFMSKYETVAAHH